MTLFRFSPSVVSALCGASLLALALPAGAASYCGANATNGQGQAKTDMTYSPGSPVPTSPAHDCYGVASGNDSAADINALNWGTGWALAAKDDIGSTADTANTVLSVNWSLAAATGTSGGWTLTGTSSTPGVLPGYFDFVGVVKGGTGWAAYLFDNVLFDGSGGGSWSITFLNGGGNIPGLSHFSIYTRAGTAPPQGGSVPLPGTLVLALLAGGLLLSTRRRAG